MTQEKDLKLVNRCLQFRCHRGILEESNLKFREEDPFREIAADIFNKFVFSSKIIGLGSGSSVASTLVHLANLSNCEEFKFIPTSIQIKIVAESLRLNIADEGKIPEIDFVLDGADQIDSNFNMIKGGGGALLKEKIVIDAAKTFVIIADTIKFVERFEIPVPIEVHPFARISALHPLEKMGFSPKLRLLGKGYPYITESGNLVYDTAFSPTDNLRGIEEDIKTIPGVMEVGFFTKKANCFYSINMDRTYSIVSP
jgi:ribose 5-phosphate isomerase A